MDYECERGAKRNFEVWRASEGDIRETDEERLNRLEREGMEEEGETTAMEELERKVGDARQEMAVADALDEIRTRNARNERSEKREAGEVVREEMDEERRRVEREDEERTRRAFVTEGGERVRRIGVDDEEGEIGVGGKERGKVLMPPPTTTGLEFKRVVKKKKDFGAALGIKKKSALV